MQKVSSSKKIFQSAINNENTSKNEIMDNEIENKNKNRYKRLIFHQNQK